MHVTNSPSNTTTTTTTTTITTTTNNNNNNTNDNHNDSNDDENNNDNNDSHNNHNNNHTNSNISNDNVEHKGSGAPRPRAGALQVLHVHALWQELFLRFKGFAELVVGETIANSPYKGSRNIASFSTLQSRRIMRV